MNEHGKTPLSSSTGMQTGKAVAVIVVVVVVGWLALAKGTKTPTTTATAATHPSHSTTTRPVLTVPTTTVPLVPPSSIKLQVLNGVGTGLYATEWSNKLKTKYGYDTLAPDDATARELAAPYGLWVRSIRTGAGAMRFPGPAETAAHEWTEQDRELVADRVSTQFTGAPATVAKGLRVLQEATEADEILVTTITHDHADRVRSYELLASGWGQA